MKIRGPLDRRCWLGVLALALTLLAGCGFALRQTPQFAFHSLYISAPETSPIVVEMRRYMTVSNVKVTTNAMEQKDAEAQLDIVGLQRLKTPVAYSTAGQVREFQLKMVLKFRLHTPLGKELLPESELVQQRSMTYDETFALSKQAEEELNYRDMQSSMVQQIMRRMAAVKSL